MPTTSTTCAPGSLHRGADASRWRVLALLSIAIVLSLTTWFSATAITPELKREWHLSPFVLSWLTVGVQIGFVCGELAASLVNLPDIVRLNRCRGDNFVYSARPARSILNLRDLDVNAHREMRSRFSTMDHGRVVGYPSLGIVSG
jgi:hypothetical protein